jgi:hypothetical protein
MGQGTNPGGANVEHECTHPQGTRVVLHHRVEPAQVVGGPGWTHLMGVAGVAAKPRGWGRWSSAMVVLVMLMEICLGQGGGGPEPKEQQGSGKQTH